MLDPAFVREHLHVVALDAEQVVRLAKIPVLLVRDPA